MPEQTTPFLELDLESFSTANSTSNMFVKSKFATAKQSLDFESMNLLSADNGCLSILDTMLNSRNDGGAIQRNDFSTMIKDNHSLFDECKFDGVDNFVNAPVDAEEPFMRDY